ncbi:unnamed protein product [Aphanomyces euteiches]|uniref:Uncharacterized protein n=1 Tax=Aphanomyces euteiches TaxID=100861 RepID=A0A6G0XT75_9STRA|nr:hypothetical protein Ae201684_001460 [Aphanomyces euteiches]KAH9075371.1 hypothetical protein Ae201684P_004051 [Aphanomyces euteiches]KAH9141328.1 hypothetical protein AeRB84_014529 [Aphanomyces euteiches]
MSVMTSMWSLAQATRAEERTHNLFTPHVESDIKNIVKKNMVHQSRDLSGWDFDKKIAVLTELQDMIEAPSFRYADWGEPVPAKFKSVPVLPLLLGQEALLDLWDYIMEFCDVVPVRTGARSLFLRLAGCICRRLEFTHDAELNGAPIKIDVTIEQRFNGLLESSMRYCALKFSKSRILTQDHAYFASHIFTAAFYRYPSVAAPLILDAVQDVTTQLCHKSKPGIETKRTHIHEHETMWLFVPDAASTCSDDGGTSSDENPASNGLEGSSSPKSPKSPQLPKRHENSQEPSQTPLAERRAQVLDKFRAYKASRLVETSEVIPITPLLPVQSSSDETLELVFQASLQLSQEDDEAKFISACPQLYDEPRYLQATVVEISLVPFLDRLRTPSRDANLVAIFVSTFHEDSSSWAKALNHGAMLWHCIPGYFVLVRAFVAIFAKVCMRRKKRETLNKEADIVVDPWFPYWESHELEPIYDGLTDVLSHGPLLNVFVQMILESTNMYDPQSVDYSFNILQNVFECAAEVNGPNHPRENSVRGHLPLSFDVAYYLEALRKALTSSHFQIILKVLAFLYATADLLESKRRQKLLSGVVLHEYFFELFLHWNEEVRRMFCHLLVYKLFCSSRLDLPLVSDRVLLATSPFFRPYNAPQPHVLQGLATYFAPPKRPSALSSLDHSTALERLIVWDTTAVLKQSNQKQKQERLFRDSLSDDELMLDLSMTSKLDAVLKMIADQIKSHDCTTYYPRHLQVYAQRAIAQYIGLLYGYYQAAFDHPSTPPPAPILEFNVQNFFGNAEQ